MDLIIIYKAIRDRASGPDDFDDQNPSPPEDTPPDKKTTADLAGNPRGQVLLSTFAVLELMLASYFLWVLYLFVLGWRYLVFVRDSSIAVESLRAASMPTSNDQVESNGFYSMCSVADF